MRCEGKSRCTNWLCGKKYVEKYIYLEVTSHEWPTAPIFFRWTFFGALICILLKDKKIQTAISLILKVTHTAETV